MTIKEFLKVLGKCRGFYVTTNGFIRKSTKTGTSQCPIIAVASYIQHKSHQAGKYYKLAYNVLNLSPTAVSNIVNAADKREKSQLRKRMLKVLKLEGLKCW